MMKKFKGFWIKDSGAVSVYAIIIILPIFILNALLIDSLRIISAERKIENAMDAALRSTLAQFHSDLAAVGLFAYGGDGASSDFQNYVTKQIPNPADLSGFQNLSNPLVVSTNASFNTSRNLVDNDVFRHQVLESMKYQAPVQLGADLVGLFTGGKGVTIEEIEKTEELVEKYEEIINLMRKRNAQIDEAILQLEEYIEVIETEIKRDILGSKVTSGDAIPSNIKTFYEMLFYNTRYKELTEKEKPSNDEKKEINNYEKALNIDLYSAVLDVEIYYQDIPEHLIGFGRTLQNPKEGSAKHYNDQILELMGDNELLKELQPSLLQDKFFQDIKTATDEIYEEVKLDRNPGSTIIDLSNPGKYSIPQLSAGFYYFMSGKNVTAGEIIIQTIETKVNDLTKKQVKTIKGQMDNYRIVKAQLENVDTEAEEEKADESFGSLWARLNEFQDIKDNISGDLDIYSELDTIVQQYNGATGIGGDDTEPARLQFIKDAFDRFKEFIEFIHGFPESVRNELYINEYILANYGISAPYELDNHESYTYASKQANYIVYGSATPGMNYFLFIKDVTLILFVANLISQGLQGGFAGPLGFFKALSAALGETLNNLNALTTGNYFAQWSPFKVFGMKTPITMTLPMFLKVIMAMKSTGKSYNNNKLRRLQAVVTKETGVNLIDAPSYIEGNVTAKVKLWFIPQLAEVLPGNVEGSYYIINMKKVYSY
ncbi:hypothetical protein [Paucisalibacillus globulus]|uniref:hypothetical protein n=1 Tax=Paucisalibacillus globulus TaxID=351095 RepID=UPI000423751E|nr:hypothetical protein [Paucisalibacillus globulus]